MHRGPDGSGVWCQGQAALGHTRLAILDLSEAARQPMVSGDGRYVMTYNGEVYNYRSLKEELLREGVSFRSHSDSEVVLEAIARWGVDRAIRRFNGMFAFAVWDRARKELLLGRDRYGIKPLHVKQTREYLAFASERSAFLNLPGARPELDVIAVAEYFTFQNIISDRTLTKGVRVFPPGHWGVVRNTPHDVSLEVHEYWDFSFGSDEVHASPAEYAEELGRLLSQAVERQLVSDVEIGAFLSGGLDSGSIVYEAASRLAQMKTFTVGFFGDSAGSLEKGRDERPAAEVISACLKTDQIESVIGAHHVWPATEHLMAHLEDPRVGQSYPNYFASRLASAFVSVALSGAGGDEILGGYPWRYPSPDESLADAEAWHFMKWQRLLSPSDVRQLLAPVAEGLAEFSAEDLHSQVFQAGLSRSGSQKPALDASLYFEAKTFLPGLLAVEDRISMAFGMETRVPFLDNDLVDFAVKIPTEIRFGDDTLADRPSAVKRTSRGKAILRAAMRGKLPKQIVDAPKQGFSAPDSSWFSGQLRPRVISAVEALDSEVFSRDFAMQRWGLRDREVVDRAAAWSILVGQLATKGY